MELLEDIEKERIEETKKLYAEKGKVQGKEVRRLGDLSEEEIKKNNAVLKLRKGKAAEIHEIPTKLECVEEKECRRE